MSQTAPDGKPWASIPLLCSLGGVPFNKEHLDAKDAEIERLKTELARVRGLPRLSVLDAENLRLRAALCALDQRIFNDPQVIERAGEWRDLIARALVNEQCVPDQSKGRPPCPSSPDGMHSFSIHGGTCFFCGAR